LSSEKLIFYDVTVVSITRIRPGEMKFS